MQTHQIRAHIAGIPLGRQGADSNVGEFHKYRRATSLEKIGNALGILHKALRPFVLDESIDGIDSLLRGHVDLAMDVVNIKIAKFGGLSRARQARDLCVSLGIAMTLEDTWGGDIVTAAIAHLAHSTPPEFLFTATDFNSYVTVGIADGAPQRIRGRMAAPAAPGLGVAPRAEVLGEPVLVFE